MTESRILIVGAGPAGLSAAVALARAGQRVIVVDQAPGIGGAIYASCRSGQKQSIAGAAHDKARRKLMADVASCGEAIEIRCSTRFAGLDYRGVAMIVGQAPEDGIMFHPKAVVMATGARELVQPRPGWTSCAVTTVGEIQIGLKTSGRAPEGRIVLAGSGPLLIAAGAQLVRAGNPPAAIIEAGRPFARPLKALRLPLPVLKEAAGYLATLRVASVPIVTGTHLLKIREVDGALQLTTTRRGRHGQIMADRLGLHDGLARNDYGVAEIEGLPVVFAGDCREVLGQRASGTDGVRAAAEVMEKLGLGGSVPKQPSLKPERIAQQALGAMFAHDGRAHLAGLPDETIICRCENRSVADLRDAMGQMTETDTPSARTIRLSGRFGMGRCQGRFCLDWVSALAGDRPDANSLRGRRWPVGPVTFAEVLNAADHCGDTEKENWRSK